MTAIASREQTVRLIQPEYVLRELLLYKKARNLANYFNISTNHRDSRINSWMFLRNTIFQNNSKFYSITNCVLLCLTAWLI